MAIALTSGAMAARHWIAGGADAADQYQSAFARRAFRPVKTAKAIWTVAEKRRGGPMLTAAANFAPPLANLAMRASRI